MEFLPKNKWAALLVFVLIVSAAVTLTLAVTRIEQDPKQTGALRFKLGKRKKA